MAAKESTKVATALVKVANPVGIVADVAQAGLELTGNKEVGKAVGKYGNIASGAMMGAAVGGPVGAAVGALGGFAIWGIGEVVGGLVGRMIGSDPTDMGDKDK